MNLTTHFFRDFRLNVIGRFLLLMVLFFILSLVLVKTSLWTLVFWLCIAILIISIEFIRYVEKFKEQFLYFVNAINEEDFSIAFPAARKKFKDKQFAEILNSLIDKFRKLRAEKEVRHHYLQTVIENINIGIISFNEKGDITLINEAAKKLFHRPYLKNIAVLKNINENLYKEITNIPSNKKSLIKFIRYDELFHLSLQANEIKIGNERIKIISMQDIKNELDENEIESWQKLVRVINHEIMNSVIPISTLANVLNQILEENINNNLIDKDLKQKSEVLHDISDGIKTIENRSQGLATFVEATKSMTNISKPVFRQVVLGDLFKRLETLLVPEAASRGIQVIFQEPERHMTIHADFEMIEQVLINLVKNAMEALDTIDSKEKIINIRSVREGTGVLINVIDNGPGIPGKELGNIFIPFYSTKKAGSGIGLSFSRHIMRLHKGSLEVSSQPGSGSNFTLRF